MGPQGPQQPQVPQQPVAPQPQPQFVQQPQAPQFQPVQAPQPTGPGFGTPVPPTKKGLSKGALWGIIGGAVALVLVAVGVILALTVFGGISKSDYVQAKSVTDEVVDAYDDAETKFDTYFSNIMSGSSTVSKIKSTKSSFESAYTTYKNKLDTLKSEKALQNSDVKKAYDAFVAKNNEFVAFVDGLQGSADALISTVDSCSSERGNEITSFSSTTIASEYDIALGQCLKDLETVSKSSNKSLADYASKTLAVYNEQRALFKELETANKSGSISAQNEARSKISEQSEDFSSISSSSTILDDLADSKLRDELTALGEAINKKIN